MCSVEMASDLFLQQVAGLSEHGRHVSYTQIHIAKQQGTGNMENAPRFPYPHIPPATADDYPTTRFTNTPLGSKDRFRGSLGI
jgi:hypothetical protein